MTRANNPPTPRTNIGDPHTPGTPHEPTPAASPAPSDPRAARTRAKLRRALMDECAGRTLAEVNVAAVVRRAGVGRATFYLHYRDLEELSVDTCAGVVREAVDALHAWRGVPDPASPPPALRAFCAELAPHAEMYRALLSPGGGGPLGRVLHEELRARSLTERRLAGAPHAELIASAVAATFAGVLADWLHGHIEADADRFAGQVWLLLVTLHRAAVR